MSLQIEFDGKLTRVSRCKASLSWPLILLVTAGCLSGCRSSKPEVSDSRSAEEPATISSELVSLKNLSIALLENGAEGDREGKLVSQAVDGFREIVGVLPSSELGHRNLAVALLFQINHRRQSNLDTTALEADFQSSIEQLKKLAPDAPDAWILESRFHQDKGEMTSAEASLRAATETKLADASTFYQLFELLQASQTQVDIGDLRRLLESALQRSPSNLVLNVAYLNNLALSQDETAFAGHLDKCKASFAPLLSRTESPLGRLLERTQTAFQDKDWKTVQTQTVFIRNSLLAEIAYLNDLNLLRPHTLEFIQLNFDRDVFRGDSDPASVRFELADLEIQLDNVSAIAAEDFDLDGHSDLVIGKAGGLEVWSFRQGAPNKIAALTIDMTPYGIVLADLDRDYQLRKESLPSSALPTTAAPDAPVVSASDFLDTDMDLIVYGKEGLRLYENRLSDEENSRSLVERPLSPGMEELTDIRHVAVIDFDHDSDLDLIVASQSHGVTLWSNRGDWTFVDFTPYSHLPDTGQVLESVIAFDADRRVLTDIFVGSDQLSGPIMLGNNLHGRFHLREMMWSKEMVGASRVIEPIDANQDACWDLITCGEKGVRLQLMKSPGRHGWKPDSADILSETPSRGLMVCDLNNDGWSDCVAWGTQGIEIFLGQGPGKLEKHSQSSLLPDSIKQCLAIDVDADGDEDIIALGEDGKLSLLRNLDGNQLQNLEVVLRADEDGGQRPRERCNMHGVGSLIELKSGGTYQARIVRGTKTRFGIGSASGAEVMRVVWPNGTPNNLFDVSNESTVFDQQRLAGSCPYLYAWNGERFEFITDCLWAAPIGLQFGPGILAPSREWEYLKIDGRMLKPKDGKYVLQMTEELWEAAYFDAIELIVVDHPAEIDVFTNEKVGPAEIASHKIYTVKNRHLPKATDPSGNDLTNIIAAGDRHYTKTWTEGIVQGVTKPHWLELDLNVAGNASDEKVLFLTGWLFPTCTSLNLALAENPLRPPMTPPSIQVPDAKGNWVEVIPFTGFPGGKTKTIAVDLKGKFLSDDHRVRLVSNMELCWDEVFFSVDERQADPSDYRLQTLLLQSADLHYRGFSKQVLQPKNAPEYFDYDQVERRSVWAPMSGAFTRYGDVLKLLTRADDMLVVMGAGDELTLEFALPDLPVPDGWVRDFVIYNVGWDKDADLNTVYGQSVEPLPFRAMKSYPFGPDEQPPDSTEYQDYLRTYQTRQQNPGEFWNQIRDSL